MEDDDTATTSTTTATTDAPVVVALPAPPAPAAGATFTQDQLTAIASREADKAGRAARKALLDELGLANTDELKAAVKGHKDQQTANQTAQERQAAAEQAAVTAQAAAADTARGRLVDRALVGAGVSVAQLDRVSRLVDVEAGADAAAVTAAVEALKVDMPALFSASTASPPSSEPGVGGPPPAQVATTGLLAAGAARAAARQGRTTT